MAVYLTTQVKQGGTYLARFSAGQLEALSKWQEGRHCNGDWEIHLLLSGSCRFQEAGAETLLEEGALAVIAPGVYHSARSLPGGFRRLTLTLSALDHGADQLLRDCAGSCRILRADGELLSISRLLLRECGETRDQKVAEALLTVLVSLILRRLGLSRSAARTPERGPGSRTDIIDGFFSHHYMQNAAEEELAKQLGLSRRQLVRVLYDKYGMSFRQKLLATRMDQAAWLLSSTELSVSEISAAVGYASETAFFHQFRQTFAATPARFRESRAPKTAAPE